MVKYDYYWRSNDAWYHQAKNGMDVLNDDAPEDAKKSYENYLRQREEHAKLLRKMGFKP